MSRRRVRVVRAAAAVCATLIAVLPVAAHAAVSSLDRATEAVVAVTMYADRVGSGVAISPDRVLTAAHVIDGAAGAPSHVAVGDTALAYEVVAIDRRRDLALLAVDLPASVPAIVWADDVLPARGQDVIALGFPIGLRSVTLSKGVVSAPSQVFEGATFIQVDAAINPGNSGGPLVDDRGRLMGITVAKVASVEVDAVGFAVPAAEVTAFLEQAEPGLRVVRDTADASGPLPVVSPSPVRPGLFAAAALGAAVLLATVAVILRRRAARRAPAEEAGGVLGAVHPRAVFRVSSPSSEREVDVRLPAVAGTAHNADVPVAADGVTPYHVRFTPVQGGVEALDLTDRDGMYCGESCMRRAALGPGDSVRFGGAVVTLVRAYEGSRSEGRTVPA